MQDRLVAVLWLAEESTSLLVDSWGLQCTSSYHEIYVQLQQYNLKTKTLSGKEILPNMHKQAVFSFMKAGVKMVA